MFSITDEYIFYIQVCMRHESRKGNIWRRKRTNRKPGGQKKVMGREKENNRILHVLLHMQDQKFKNIRHESCIYAFEHINMSDMKTVLFRKRKGNSTAGKAKKIMMGMNMSKLQ